MPDGYLLDLLMGTHHYSACFPLRLADVMDDGVRAEILLVRPGYAMMRGSHQAEIILYGTLLPK